MQHKIQVYNSATRKKELFKPIDENNVRMYVCGPTLYDDIHIGNARPLIVFDIFYKLLSFNFKVVYIRNVTDIDDKIISRAATDFPHLPIEKAVKLLVEQTKQKFENICDLLNCSLPDAQPMVSENLAEIRLFIEKLVQENHAYIAQDNVLFDINSCANYGGLSGKEIKDLLAGARVETVSYKKDEADFVLWKPSKEGEPGWDSPCGIAAPGRPGWHIECSAMVMRYLCQPFGGGFDKNSIYNIIDIHAGGVDLLFPHHENETAQTCSALNIEKMANYWLHNGYVEVEGRKMSKSEGNFIKAKDIVQDKFTGNVLRLAMLQTHYRKNFNWTQDLYHRAETEYKNWLLAIKQASFYTNDIEDFLAALADDLNTPQAITIMREYYKNKQYDKLSSAMRFLNFSFETADISKEAESLTKQRDKAIANKDWQQADDLRAQIEKLGYVVQDVKLADGSRVSRVTRLS